MTQLVGNRALLQAFLADAQRYLEEFLAALAPAGQTSADAALEALRGIRIGAEFLEIVPLAELCRQQESRLARIVGAPSEEAREDLLEAGREIGRYLAALGAAANPAAQVDVCAATGHGGDLADLGGEAIEAGPESLRGQDAFPPDQLISGPPQPEPPAAAGAPVAEMFKEWMREWRAFREQIERLYLGSAGRPSGKPLDTENETAAQDAAPVQAENLTEPAAFDAGESTAAAAPPRPQAPSPEFPEAETTAVLKLSIGPALFGLPAADVLGFAEPTRDVKALSVENALAAVNGAAVPVLDVRGRWQLGERPADARIVLVESGRQRIGLWVDRVHGTESLRIQPLFPAALFPAELGGAALSAQGEVVLVLRPDAVAAPGNEA